ncbi:MAG: hypothetical protein WA631_10885, partial [Nitrososphaeraceae archaeon]
MEFPQICNNSIPFANNAVPAEALITAILDELGNYDVSIGHNICGISDEKGRGVDSDLIILQSN